MPAQADRGHVQPLGQLGLFQALLPGQHEQHLPAGAAEVVLAGAAVEIAAQQTGGAVQLKADAGGSVLFVHGGKRLRKCAYYKQT